MCALLILCKWWLVAKSPSHVLVMHACIASIFIHSGLYPLSPLALLLKLTLRANISSICTNEGISRNNLATFSRLMRSCIGWATRLHSLLLGSRWRFRWDRGTVAMPRSRSMPSACRLIIVHLDFKFKLISNNSLDANSLQNPTTTIPINQASKADRHIRT